MPEKADDGDDRHTGSQHHQAVLRSSDQMPRQGEHDENDQEQEDQDHESHPRIPDALVENARQG